MRASNFFNFFHFNIFFQPGLQLKDVNGLSRSELEMGADFLGLIIMQNLVKKETYGAIKAIYATQLEFTGGVYSFRF